MIHLTALYEEIDKDMEDVLALRCTFVHLEGEKNENLPFHLTAPLSDPTVQFATDKRVIISDINYKINQSRECFLATSQTQQIDSVQMNLNL